MPIRVLLADDHAIVRNGVAQILRKLERAARPGIGRTFVSGLETGSEVVASWSPAEE